MSLIPRGVALARRGAEFAMMLLLVALALPAAASAHATLEGSTPQRGATLAHAPAQVVFRYDEPVEGSFGAVRVYDAKGRRVDAGDAFHPGGVGSQLAVHLRRGLPDGAYTATYRVVSADGHIVSSGIVFAVGQAGASGKSVQSLLAASKTGSVTSAAFAVARGLQYGALGVAGGTLVFLLVVWGAAVARLQPAPGEWADGAGAFTCRCRRLLLGAAVVGVVSAAAQIVLETAEAAGVSGWAAIRAHLVRETVSTRFGTIMTVALGCWVLAGILAAVLIRVRGRRASTGAAPATLAIPLGYVALAPALSGHASTQSPVGVLLAANVLHVFAMTAWLGGLVALLVAVPAATRRLAGTDRTALLAGALARFSAIALFAVAVLLATGLVQAIFEIRHLDLVFTTAFGRAVVIKAALLAALIALGAVNRRRTVPRLQAADARRETPGAAGVLLRRTLRAEVALVAAVLTVTGFLAGYPPPTTAASGPFSATTRVGPEALEIAVDPASVGANEVHLYLTDPRTGAQLDRAKEVDVGAALPSKHIGEIVEKAHKAGPGHYIVPRLMLAVPGTWRLTVTVRVSAFDEYARRLEVRVR